MYQINFRRICPLSPGTSTHIIRTGLKRNCKAQTSWRKGISLAQLKLLSTVSNSTTSWTLKRFVHVALGDRRPRPRRGPACDRATWAPAPRPAGPSQASWPASRRRRFGRRRLPGQTPHHRPWPPGMRPRTTSPTLRAIHRRLFLSSCKLVSPPLPLGEGGGLIGTINLSPAT